jgi:hypothetical protein
VILLSCTHRSDECLVPARAKAHLLSKDGRLKTTDDPGGVGSEIIREILVCLSCVEGASGHSSEDCGPPVLAVAA